jgi:murein DD-endopeptidase MepM/ murein hydrolase activator NlpD
MDEEPPSRLIRVRALLRNRQGAVRSLLQGGVVLFVLVALWQAGIESRSGAPRPWGIADLGPMRAVVDPFAASPLPVPSSLPDKVPDGAAPAVQEFVSQESTPAAAKGLAPSITISPDSDSSGNAWRDIPSVADLFAELPDASDRSVEIESPHLGAPQGVDSPDASTGDGERQEVARQAESPQAEDGVQGLPVEPVHAGGAELPEEPAPEMTGIVVDGIFVSIIPSLPLPAAALASIDTGQWVWPVQGEISQGYTSTHRAVDISTEHGAVVVAANAGKVVYAKWESSGYGYLVIIDHGNGFVSYYAHLYGFYIDAGQMVARGEQIGELGTTGHSTGPHLHFEIRRDGVQRDPLDLLP